MKVLIVCSKNSGQIAPFILEQGEALVRAGVELNYFPIAGKGFFGYLKNRKTLLKLIREFQPDLIHAHYGLSGLLANTQRRTPVVTTYHGSDINNKKVYPFSRINMILSAYNIFVSKNITPKSPRPLSSAIWRILSPTGERQRKNSLWDLRRFKHSLIPCGVDISLFKQLDKQQSRKVLGLDNDKKYVLFAGAFNNAVKNPNLAKAALALLPDVKLIELKNYTREQVVLLLNAVDAVLMTSFTEGSPQIIKEALACNCPVVSVNVGDVKEIISTIDGCYITSYNPEDISNAINKAILFGKLVNANKRIIDLGLDSQTVAKKIIQVYDNVLKKK